MKVYTVFVYDYENSYIEGVFLTKKDAEEHMISLPEDDIINSTIEEWEVK